jgi:hypothetical protein
MRASGRIHRLRNVRTHCEVFAHRENQIRFHNRFLFSIAGYGRDAACAPRKLAFALQKLLNVRAVIFPSRQDWVRNSRGGTAALLSDE